MCVAAAAGDTDRLRALVRVHGMSVNTSDYDQRTAMHLAASEGALETIRCLVDELHALISPADRWGGTPLDDAIRGGHAAVAEYLESKGALSGSLDTADAVHLLTDMCVAAAAGDTDRLRALVRVHGISVNTSDYDQRTAMHLAASEGALETIRCLVDELHALISPVDRWGGTPLDDAIRGGHAAVAKYLESKGALSGSLDTADAAHKLPTREHVEAYHWATSTTVHTRTH
jgi:ankyrin repeat protein